LPDPHQKKRSSLRAPSRLACVAALLGLILFGALMLLTSSGVTDAVDDAVLSSLEETKSPQLTAVLTVISVMGAWPTVVAIIALFALREWRRGQADWRQLFVATAGGGLLSLLIKRAIKRPRPTQIGGLFGASGFSFPSGHAVLSLAFYGMLARILARRTASRRRAIAIYAIVGLLVLLIGYSRLYLGVHYLTDVTAGYAIGEAWLSAVVLWFDRREATSHPSRIA